eukprot:4178149-Prymnesium_polylepis.1
MAATYVWQTGHNCSESSGSSMMFAPGPNWTLVRIAFCGPAPCSVDQAAALGGAAQRRRRAGSTLSHALPPRWLLRTQGLFRARALRRHCRHLRKPALLDLMVIRERMVAVMAAIVAVIRKRMAAVMAAVMAAIVAAVVTAAAWTAARTCRAHCSAASGETPASCRCADPVRHEATRLAFCHPSARARRPSRG